MARLILIAIVLALTGGGIYIYSNLPKNQPAAVAGEKAPDFELEDIKGNKVRLSDLRGKVVIVNFWATWCPPCREEMPSMGRLNEIFGSQDFALLAINVEEEGRRTVPAFLQKTPYQFTILYDDQTIVQQRYGVFQFPESFVVRKDGTIDQKLVGALDWSSADAIAYFKKLLNE